MYLLTNVITMLMQQALSPYVPSTQTRMRN